MRPPPREEPSLKPQVWHSNLDPNPKGAPRPRLWSHHLSQVTGTNLSAVRWFEAEHVHDDGGRSDLAGIDAGGRPVLVVEVEFGAILETERVRSYLDYQERKLGPGTHGALVVLVPAIREDEANRILEAVHREGTGEDAAAYRIATMVMTWNTWLGVWDAAVAHLLANLDSLAGDLVQLRDLCLTLGGPVIAPIDVTRPWPDREEDLRILVDQVTAQLKDPDGRMPPIVHEPGFDPLRYLPGGYSVQDNHLAVGLASRFADEGTSPLWVRWGKDNSDFSAIRARIMTSTFANDGRSNDGHLWLPLAIRPDLAGPDLVENLVAQIRDMQSALAAPGLGRGHLSIEIVV